MTAHSHIVAGNTEHTRPENRAFYPALDGIRAVAFLMVFGQHYLQIPWGWAGVDLFFVLSGFLITGILFDTRDDAHRVRNFYIRRTLRIFPLYYGIMIAMLIAEPLLRWEWNWHWLVWPAYLGNYARFVHAYSLGSPLQQLADFQPRAALAGKHVTLYLGHFWSLCVEEQFYLIWPWLVFWIRDRRKLAWVCAITLPVCLAMRIVAQHALPTWMLDNEILYRVTPFRLDALLIGGLLALVLRGPSAHIMLRFARWALPIALAITLLWLLITPSGHLLVRPYTYSSWKFTFGLSIIDILAALLILVAIKTDSFSYRLFKARPLRWLGRVSYGAYVWHDIPHPLYVSAATIIQHRLAVVHPVGALVAPKIVMLITAILALPATLLLSWLSFRFFESPFLNLKERWTIRHNQAA